MDLCARMTIRDVAEHTRLHWETVKNIDKKRLKRQLPRAEDLRPVKYLGIDEVSVRRGHRYLTTVVDLQTGRVVYVGEGTADGEPRAVYQAPEATRDSS